MADTHVMPNLTHLASEYGALADREPTEEELSAWRRLGTYVRVTSRVLAHRDGLRIIVTPNPEPYATADEQAADLRSGVFVVSSAHCDHPVWDVETNIAYRTVHDVLGHGAYLPAPFTVSGELVAWDRQLGYLRRSECSPAVIRAAYTETVGQLAYAAVTGDFHPAQPIGFLSADPFAPIRDDR